jgi:hypothetical protein
MFIDENFNVEHGKVGAEESFDSHARALQEVPLSSLVDMNNRVFSNYNAV